MELRKGLVEVFGYIGIEETIFLMPLWSPTVYNTMY